MSGTDVRLPQHGRDHRLVVVDGVVRDGGSDPITGLADILNDSTGGPRIVRGAVLNDAGIIEGTGFTAKWSLFDDSQPNENYITIMFDEPFDEPGPIVTYGENNNNPADVEGEYKVSTKTRNASYVEVVGKELDGTPNIGGFDFVAIEAES